METNCKTGLEPNLISKGVYEREISLCKELSAKENCCWGKCEHCGVLPLLEKLYNGKLIETEEELNKLRNGLKKG